MTDRDQPAVDETPEAVEAALMPTDGDALDANTLPVPVPEEDLVAAAEATPSTAPEPLFVISLATLAWVAAVALFAGLRIGPIWQAPVTGPELIHLSGAWQASLGVTDDRFVATLFQALSAVLLRFSDSEIGPRVLATAATMTIPLAVYRLRRLFGEPAALLALVLLAVDAPGIVFGTAASAMGFDLAIAMWLFVLIAEGRPRHPVALGVAGFLAATAGALVLPSLVALLVRLLILRRRPALTNRDLGALAAGAVIGLVAALVGFGTGVNGFRIPAIQLFADSFEQPWSTADTLEVLILYSIAFVVGGAGAVWWWLRTARTHALPHWAQLLLVWVGVAFAWCLASANAESSAPAAALGLPLALLIAPALVRAIDAMFHADWSIARFMLPLGAVAAAVGMNYVVDWARVEDVGSLRTQIIVVGMTIATLVALVPLGMLREMRPTLFAPALAVAAIPTLAGAFGAGLSANPEPLLSPNSTAQSRLLRDDVLRAAGEAGGTIVVHPELVDDLTWPFRDSGTLVEASSPTDDAAILIWPERLPQPEGFTRISGDWALTEAVQIPTDTFLEYLHWMIDSNRIVVTPERIAVYQRTLE